MVEDRPQLRVEGEGHALREAPVDAGQLDDLTPPVVEVGVEEGLDHGRGAEVELLVTLDRDLEHGDQVNLGAK